MTTAAAARWWAATDMGLPAVNHQSGFAAACVTPVADRAVLDGAVAMAGTAADLGGLRSSPGSWGDVG